jgi:hypothetical protein
VERTSSSDLEAVVGLLGLTDDETLEIFGVDPLSLIAGGLDHRPELPILHALAVAAAEHAGPAGLRRWLRANGPTGRPIGLLVAGDFAGFEDALGGLADRGLVVRADPIAGRRRRPTTGPGRGD